MSKMRHGNLSKPLKGLSEKEEEMVEKGIKQLRENIKLGSEKGKALGVDLGESNS